MPPAVTTEHPREPPGLTARPDPAAWPAPPSPPDERARRVRLELGLPTDRSVFMSGHQCHIWHPGILAKWFAIQAAAERHRASAAWVEVDQDTEALSIAYPGPGPTRLTWRPAPAPPQPLPAGITPPVPADRLVQVPRTPFDFATDGLNRIAAALARASHAPSLASQVSIAIGDLLAWSGAPPHRVSALSLHRTSLFAELLEALARDPRRAIGLHNAAAARHPEARVRALRTDESTIELPLWRITPDRPRRHVFAAELPSIPPAQLAPKGLLMTALLRAGACDLFIHGLGGEKYDRITDEWIREWLGWRLAPTAVVTATRVLPFDRADAPTPDAIARARWLSHRARHDPALLGDERRAAIKAELVARISASSAPPERLRLYRELRALIGESTGAGAARLAELDARAHLLGSAQRHSGVIYDRTWPFPLYPRPALQELQAAVRALLGAGS